MKTVFIVVLLTCMLCFGLIGCGKSDKFVGVWEGRKGPSVLVYSSRIPVFVQIKRASSENKYYVKTIAPTEKIPTNPVFQKAMILTDVTAVLEDGRLLFEDGSTAEIDPKTGKLHMDDMILTKTKYDIDIF